jgi:hypothetical protein
MACGPIMNVCWGGVKKYYIKIIDPEHEYDDKGQEECQAAGKDA